jgi:hypothetical protein
VSGLLWKAREQRGRGNVHLRTKAKKNGGIQYNTQCKKIGKKADAYLSGAKNKMGKSYKCGECPIDQE